ncbi:MAG: hypothetical protein ACREUU_11115 [Gammaproteobacteria bacterium]
MNSRLSVSNVNKLACLPAANREVNPKGAFTHLYRSYRLEFFPGYGFD